MVKELWPDEILQQHEEGDDVGGIEFSNVWPSAHDMNPFDELDDDGWNLYNDQRGGDWYSFVENETPPSHTIASITDYFEDDCRQEVETPFAISENTTSSQREGSVAGSTFLHKNVTLIREEEKNIKTLPTPFSAPKSSPGAKLRSSLSKLSCWSPDKQGGQARRIIEPSPPMRLGAAAHQFPLDDDDESDDPRPISQSSWLTAAKLDKNFLVSVQEIDRYCGQDKYPSIHNKLERTNSDDYFSPDPVNSTGKASSIAGCAIDSNLARALDFRCTPEKYQKKVVDCDWGIRSEGGGGKVVADRHKWLLDAFKTNGQSKDSDESSSTSPSINLSTKIEKTKIDKYGGPRKSAVQRRREEWENKLAQKKAEEFRPKLTIKTQWAYTDDGSYKKSVVLKSAE